MMTSIQPKTSCENPARCSVEKGLRRPVCRRRCLQVCSLARPLEPAPPRYITTRTTLFPVPRSSSRAQTRPHQPALCFASARTRPPARKMHTFCSRAHAPPQIFTSPCPFISIPTDVCFPIAQILRPSYESSTMQGGESADLAPG